MKYRLNYVIDNLKPLKSAILLILFFIDMLMIVSVILSVYFYPFILIYLLIEAVISFAIKIAATFLTYTLKCEFKDNTFAITKEFPLKTFEKLKLNIIDDYRINKLDCEKFDTKAIKNQYKNCVILCDKSCLDSLYVLELHSKFYIISVDKFMVALLDKKMQSVEEN